MRAFHFSYSCLKLLFSNFFCRFPHGSPSRRCLTSFVRPWRQLASQRYGTGLSSLTTIESRARYAYYGPTSCLIPFQSYYPVIRSCPSLISLPLLFRAPADGTYWAADVPRGDKRQLFAADAGTRGHGDSGL